MKNLAQQVMSGKAHLKRLPYADEQGRIAGGVHMVAASLIAEKCEQNSNSKQIRNAQEVALKAYAKAEGIWTDEAHTLYGQRIDSGAENIVFWDERQPTIVTKINDFALHDTPLEFFDRTAIHNHLFPEATITVIGFTNNTLRNGRFSVVIQQPFIKAIRGAQYKEVATYMQQMGFEDMGKTYINDTYIIDDLHPGNILVSPKGNYVVIDEIACLNTPDEDFEGTQNYAPILADEDHCNPTNLTKADLYLNPFHREVSEAAQQEVTKMLQQPLSEAEVLAQIQKIKADMLEESHRRMRD